MSHVNYFLSKHTAAQWTSSEPMRPCRMQTIPINCHFMALRRGAFVNHFRTAISPGYETPVWNFRHSKEGITSSHHCIHTVMFTFARAVNPLPLGDFIIHWPWSALNELFCDFRGERCFRKHRGGNAQLSRGANLLSTNWTMYWPHGCRRG